MRNIFIVNPTAGKGKEAKKLMQSIADYFRCHGGDYQILQTKNLGDATALARNACKGKDAVNIFACGGDGTTYEVLNGMFGCENARLGIIPCGSGNDFIKYFNNRDVFFDLNEQLNGETVLLDAIKMGDYVALNSCSVGMDAMVADNVRLFKKLPISASLAYILSSAYTTFKKFNCTLKITIDGRPLGETPCFFAVCANAPFYGGGFKCAPTACPGDGKLEYSILEGTSKLQIIKILGHYRKGTHIALPNCRYGGCHSMEISASRPMAINLDGEILYGSDAKFELMPSAVPFILPQALVPMFKSAFHREAELV